MRRSTRSAFALCLALLPAAPLAAHETVAVLGALATRDLPDVCGVFGESDAVVAVRTSIGLVTADAAGAWHVGCPSLLGENATSVFAATHDGALLSAIVSGTLHVSVDGGCTWSRVALPGSDAFAYEMVGDLDRIWVLARDAEQARLHSVERSGALDTHVEWPRNGEGAWTPDSVLVDTGAETGTRLHVAGARPGARVAVLRIDESGAFEEAGWAIPETGVAMQRLAPRGTLDDGRLLLVATDPAGRRVIATAPADPTPSALTLIPAAQSLHGPVWTGTYWLAVADGLLWTLDAAGNSATHASVDWKCLQRLGERTFVCDLYDLLELIDVDAALADGTGTLAVFSTAQIGPPDEACGRDEAEAQICADDWIHYGAENGFVTRAPALCPDGSGEWPDASGEWPDASDADAGGTLEGGEDGGSGCAAAGAAAGAPVWALLLAWRRRRSA